MLLSKLMSFLTSVLPYAEFSLIIQPQFCAAASLILIWVDAVLKDSKGEQINKKIKQLLFIPLKLFYILLSYRTNFHVYHWSLFKDQCKLQHICKREEKWRRFKKMFTNLNLKNVICVFMWYVYLLLHS